MVSSGRLVSVIGLGVARRLIGIDLTAGLCLMMIVMQPQSPGGAACLNTV